jgi:hypothetical protein
MLANPPFIVLNRTLMAPEKHTFHLPKRDFAAAYAGTKQRELAAPGGRFERS